MLISDEKTLRDIQREFNEKFPYLKLEFYSVGHGPNEGSPEQLHLDPGQPIGSVRRVHETGDLSIHGHQKVSTLEQNFLDSFGLNVQVFRRSGNLWLQTTATDGWSLGEQNERGRAETEFHSKTHGEEMM